MTMTTMTAEQCAGRPVSLPSPNPTVSYWQDPPSAIAAFCSTPSLPVHVDIVIVGSGITGASIALHLLNDSPFRLSRSTPLSVLMLEARTACSGATGRNGGHTKCASYRSFLDNVNTVGEGEAARIARFEYSCMKAVHKYAREYGIACDSWEGDSVDIIYDAHEWRVAQESIERIKIVLSDEDPAARYTFWNAEEAEKKFFAPGALGAVTYEAGSVSAYKLVIGLLQVALDKGLNLQTQTPATKIERHDNEAGACDGDAAGEPFWTVETPRGTIRATRVVLATNGYTAHLVPELHRTIVPLRGEMTAQRPGNGLPTAGLATTYSFIYAGSYEYMIARPPGSRFAGDIMIGGGRTKGVNGGVNELGNSDDTTIDESVMKYLRESAKTYFGGYWGEDHAEGRIRQEWTGVMGYSADGMPFVGEIPGREGLYLAASFQGHGMVLCLLIGKALATMMKKKKTRADDQDAEDLHKWFPNAFRVTPERMAKKFSEEGFR